MFPSDFQLWLAGLEIEGVVNRGRCPIDNAQIERCNGIWVDHVSAGARDLSWTQLQEQTDKAWADRRDRLPSRNPYCQGKPPSIALPQLNVVRRSYDIDRETQLFDIQRVYLYLSRWRWQRKVDSWGRISLCDTNYRVGRIFVGQIIELYFSLTDKCFHVVSTSNPTDIITTISLPQVDAAYLQGTL